MPSLQLERLRMGCDSQSSELGTSVAPHSFPMLRMIPAANGKWEREMGKGNGKGKWERKWEMGMESVTDASRAYPSSPSRMRCKVFEYFYFSTGGFSFSP